MSVPLKMGWLDTREEAEGGKQRRLYLHFQPSSYSCWAPSPREASSSRGRSTKDCGFPATAAYADTGSWAAGTGSWAAGTVGPGNRCLQPRRPPRDSGPSHLPPDSSRRCWMLPKWAPFSTSGNDGRETRFKQQWGHPDELLAEAVKCGNRCICII